jgi:hypothetical protein
MFHDTERTLSELDPNTRRMGGQVETAPDMVLRPAARCARVCDAPVPAALHTSIPNFSAMIANAGRMPFAGLVPSASRRIAPE